LVKDPIGEGKDGPVYLKDIWPTAAEIKQTLEKALTPKMFRERYGDVFAGTKQWQEIKAGDSFTYSWDDASTYVRNPPFFDGMEKTPGQLSDIKGARALAILGDNT